MPRSRKTEGEMQVVVLRFGGRPQRVSCDEGATVEDVIEEAGFTVKESDEITVNGDSVDKDELDNILVEDADRVVLTPNMQGGR